MLAKLIGDLLGRGRPRPRGSTLAVPDVDRLKAALALEKSGQLADAERIYRELMREHPDNIDILHLAGHAARLRGSIDEAIELLRRAAVLAPESAEIHFHLGDALSAGGEMARAAQHYRQALEADPEFAPASSGLGHALRALGNLDAAAAAYQRAVDLRPDFADFHTALGAALLELGRRDAALAVLRRALELQPGAADAHVNLGHTLHELGCSELSIAAYCRAVELRPELPEVHLHLGSALFADGYGAAQAAANFKRAIELRPAFTEARFNHALTLLARGELAEGWKDFELRFDAALGARRVPRAVLPQPQWQGEDLHGKSLLVWGEQGVGDQVQFATLVPELAARARDCTFVCLPKLVPLFARSFPAATVTAELPRTSSAGGFDFQSAAGSTARWLRPDLASFPRGGGYLTADSARVAYWRERFAGLGAGLRVGFSWRSHDLRGDRALSCSMLDDWQPLFLIAGAHWICLQYDDCAAELDAARKAQGVTVQRMPDVDMFDDLDETAALIMALDLVISAPTTVSVLAAALGVETWQMMYGYDWQTHGTERNLWLPAMRQFRRGWNERWDQVTARIAPQLADRVATGER